MTTSSDAASASGFSPLGAAGATPVAVCSRTKLLSAAVCSAADERATAGRRGTFGCFWFSSALRPLRGGGCYCPCLERGRGRVPVSLSVPRPVLRWSLRGLCPGWSTLVAPSGLVAWSGALPRPATHSVVVFKVRPPFGVTVLRP